MKFIIVENDEKWQESIKKIILDLVFERTDVTILQFSCGTKALIDEIKNSNEPKIFILDLELNNKVSGFEIAKKIREYDWESYIIILTSHDNMFETIYRNVYEVFDFIEKYYNADRRLKKDLKTILSRKFDNGVFTFSSKNVDIQVHYKDILYIERDTVSRKLIMYATTTDYIVNMALSDLLEELDSRFKQVHRACIVNTDHVAKYDWKNGEFKLKTGKVVPLLSKKFKKDSKKSKPEDEEVEEVCQ